MTPEPACPHLHGRLPPYGAHAWQCRTCHGVWLAGARVDHVIGAPRIDRSLAVVAHTRLHCPQDGLRLSALVHHGVEIDVCGHCHGVWLDAGEHTALRQAAQRQHATDHAGLVDAAATLTPPADSSLPARTAARAAHDRDGAWPGLDPGALLQDILDALGNAVSGL